MDTDRINAALGAPSVRYRNDGTPGHYRAEMQVLGWRVVYRETPFEWVEGRYYLVDRVFDTGPFVRVTGGIRLRPVGAGSELEVYADIVGRGPLWKGLIRTLIGPQGLRKYLSFVRSMEAASEASAPASIARIANSPVNEEELKRRRAAAEAAGAAPDLLDRLVRFLREGSDTAVSRIRPFECADAWQLDRTEVLALFLRCAKTGLLDLSWDVICPHCRADVSKAPDLSGLSVAAACDTCQYQFRVDLAGTVEVTFKVNAAIRDARRYVFCLGGPGNKPAVAVQWRIGPGATRAEATDLRPGHYLLRTFPATREIPLVVPDSASGLTVRLSEEGPAVTPDLPAPGELRVENAGRAEMVVLIERQGWRDAAATAASVLALQEFRDLFPSATVASGVEIAIGSIAFLFTDLKGSTELYRRVGDASAFDFVHRHFEYLVRSAAEHRGGLVKTMGDAIMASFPSGEAALRAAVSMQRGWRTFFASADPGFALSLKIGLHEGPAIAINANGRLDFFGNTVNTAARIQGQSDGGDIMMSAELAGEPALQTIIRQEGLRSSEERVWLKGLEGERALIRIRLPDELSASAG